MSLPDYTIEGATEWFDLEDSNHDGVVSRAELLRIAQNVGLGEEEAAQTVDGYYMDADMNGDNVLDWEGEIGTAPLTGVIWATAAFQIEALFQTVNV